MVKVWHLPEQWTSQSDGVDPVLHSAAVPKEKSFTEEETKSSAVVGTRKVTEEKQWLDAADPQRKSTGPKIDIRRKSHEADEDLGGWENS